MHEYLYSVHVDKNDQKSLYMIYSRRPQPITRWQNDYLNITTYRQPRNKKNQKTNFVKSTQDFVAPPKLLFGTKKLHVSETRLSETIPYEDSTSIHKHAF